MYREAERKSMEGFQHEREKQLERLREEAEQTRRAQEEAQKEADRRRDEAALTARKAAHEAAARALESEVARVRAEAEAGLKGDLERFRKEAAEARLAQAQSQLESETLRELAAQEARMAAQAASRARGTTTLRLQFGGAVEETNFGVFRM